MTRRCSVMRMPVAAQRASIPVGFGADEDFNAVMDSCLAGTPSATRRILRQVAAHQKCIRSFAAGLSIVAFAASDDGKSRTFVEPPRRLIVFFDLEKDAAHAASRQMTKMCQQQVA